MDVTPRIKEGLNVIQSYKPGQVTAGHTTYDAPVFITSEDVVEDAQITDIEVYAPERDVVLVAAPEDFSAEEFLKLKQKFSNLEIMSIDAACRTFNVLLTEGRRAGLFIMAQT